MPQNIDWNSLGFSYRDTKNHVLYRWKSGKWDSGKTQSEPFVKLHIAATALHYGQSAFEGLKAARCKDGKVRIFRPDENAKRLQTTANRILMPEVPESLFLEAIHRAVKENIEYIPPYGSGGALYIRPLLFGSGPQIGLNPADEFVFMVLTVPVGDYYRGGIMSMSAIVLDGYDRTAPEGTGHVKVGGNYAAGLKPSKVAKDQGFPMNLYLDSREHRYVDEFATSNFIGITKDKTYITPDSKSVLPSITNQTLMTLAKDQGLKVERRSIEFDEINDLEEVGACGTAVVLAPVNRIVRGKEEIIVRAEEGFGPVLESLYQELRGLQYGEISDRHGWNHEL